MTTTWNDRGDYDESAADHAALLEQMQRNWTWPQRDRDGLTALERAEMERDLAAEALDRAEHDLERVREYLRSVAR